MSATVNAGPMISAGNMLDALSGAPQNTDPLAGPDITYQADGFPDVRYYPMPKDALDNPGVIPTFFNTPEILSVNCIPSTVGTAGGPANVASPQPAINGTAMTLATNASVGITLNVPYRNFATGLVQTGALAMDLGIETPTVTSANKTVTVANSSIYRNGQPIIITNVGNAAGTTHLFTYVTGTPTPTTITIADSPLASNSTTARICSGLPGWANLNGATPAIRPTFYAPYVAGGAALIWDETQALERGIAVTGTVAATGGSFTVRGADIYGQTQSEIITIASGATTGKSKKCYKIINSVTPGFVDSTHTYSVTTQDLFGFMFRSDLWENLSIFYAGSFIISNVGWTAGDQTSPATTSTGDPRGTYALQTSSQGINRLAFYQTLPFSNSGKASPQTPQYLYGTTPV
jgi:hypothetical protein